MSAKIKRMVDRTLLYYVIIGVLNFVICTALMFVLFNICGFSDHVAPLFNYGLGSLIWYLGCRYILFPDQKTTSRQMIRFLIEVVVCYLLSYYLAAPLLSGLLLRLETMRRLFSFGGNSVQMIEGNCQMTVGAIVYAVINYFGQRYFVFTARFEHIRRYQQKKHDL